MSRTVDLDDLGPVAAARLADDVAAAALVCFPTDTVYGIGGIATAATAAAIAHVKGRRPDKPLQLVYPTLELLLASVPLAPAVGAAVRRLLPGPFTLVVPYPDGLRFPPPGVLESPGAAPQKTLGVRVPAWPRAARALAALPFPLIASSANLSGGKDPAALAAVDPAVRAACDLLLDAGPTSGVSSTVLDLSGLPAGRGFRVLRAGAVSAAEIASILASHEDGLRHFSQEGPAAL
jgi:L-threonylcarbamoyladenylate synthase